MDQTGTKDVIHNVCHCCLPQVQDAMQPYVAGVARTAGGGDKWWTAFITTTSSTPTSPSDSKKTKTRVETKTPTAVIITAYLIRISPSANKHKYKYKYKDKEKVTKRPHMCYIFENDMTQGYQIWWWWVRPDQTSFSQFLAVSHRFSPFLTVSHRFLLFLTVSHRFFS